ncbi:hypothetical protein B0T24DRAFT_638567 [Lasiosphaeria ovina]|uniref:Uncharacterized protein n=1 Tax=Lasiosphaeria ovina TaxID=92902 RepID=A0AAE0JUV0_9PEZI|nr:hypothetical protein B0T24DRAFT_638567 [Lasiosphaeria ovina]
MRKWRRGLFVVAVISISPGPAPRGTLSDPHSRRGSSLGGWRGMLTMAGGTCTVGEGAGCGVCILEAAFR